MQAAATRLIPAAAGGCTILRAVSGRIATKQFWSVRDGRVRKSEYGNERLFTLEPVAAENIVGFADVLHRLERDRHAFIVRGAPLPDANRACARRLLYHDASTGDRPTFAAAHRCWVMVDLDGIGCPAGLDPRVPGDGEELIEYLTGLLPVEFHDATCFWQWSASQSVPERLGSQPSDELRAHLFFWLDRAVPDSDLRQWASRLKQRGLPIDPAVFAPVQPHYIAAPVFDRVPDLLPQRSGLRRRLLDKVSLVLPEQSSSVQVNGHAGRVYDGSGVGFHLNRIGPEGYQEPIKATVAAFVARYGPEADGGSIKAEIRARIEEVSREHPRSARDLDRYRSDRFLDDKLAWTQAREYAAAAAASPDRASLPPYFGEESADRDAVLAEQRSTIRDWLVRNQKIAHARQEIERRRKAALVEAGIVEDPLDLDPEKSENRRRKAAITRHVRGQVLAELGLESLPRQGERTLITGAQGTGKSRAVAETIARLGGTVAIRWLVPTIDKAEEQAIEYGRSARSESPPVWVVRGRGARDPEDPGTPMCPRHKVVNRAAAMGVEVQKEICDSCALKDMCGYQRQKQDMREAAEGSGLFITSAEYLWMPCPAPHADILIVDESIIGRATESISLDPRRLTEDDKWAGKDIGGSMRRREVAALVRRAITEHQGGELAFLRVHGVTLDDLKTALKHLATREDSRPKVHGRMTDQAMAKALEAVEARETRKLLILFRQVRREFDQPRAMLNSVWFNPKSRVIINGQVGFEPRIFVGYLRAPRLGESMPVLTLDGTGSLVLNRKVFGERMLEHRFPVPRNAEVIQVSGKVFSRQSLTGTDRCGNAISPAKMAEAEHLRDHVLALVRTLPRTVLLVTYKAVEEIVKPLLPPHVRIAHFGALRGLNTFQACGTVIVLGREQPGASAIEALARPFTATDPEPFIPFGGYARQCRARRMRDTSTQIEVVEVHPDPRCQELLEQVREAEIVQAVDRVRPVFHRRRIILLTKLPVDVTVDRVSPWADLRPSRFAQAFARRGVLPLSPRDLARAFPDLWMSEKAAELDLQRQGPKTPLKVQIDSIIWGLRGVFSRPPHVTITSCHYRRRNQRGPLARALVRTDLPECRAALEALIGPLVEFVPDDEPAAAGAGIDLSQPAPRPGESHQEAFTHA